VSPVGDGDFADADGDARRENEIKRLSAAFGGLGVGDLPEEEDLDASQEAGSASAGGRVLQDGFGRAQLGGGGNSKFGAGS